MAIICSSPIQVHEGIRYLGKSLSACLKAQLYSANPKLANLLIRLK